MGLSDAKMKCVINTADHCEKIANILRALDARIPVSETELENILNYVLKDKTEYMTDEKLIHGYVFGHVVGLSFIVELSQELIMLKLPKNVAWGYHSFLIDALVMADSVNDCKLFEAAARKFDEWEGELDNPEALIKAVKERGTKGKFTSYTLRRRHKKMIGKFNLLTFNITFGKKVWNQHQHFPTRNKM